MDENQEIVFSDTEKIELLKDNLMNMISSFELPINIVYFVYKDCFNDLTAMYAEYQKKLYENIRQKQEELNKQKYAQSFKDANPDMKMEGYSVGEKKEVES